MSNNDTNDDDDGPEKIKCNKSVKLNKGKKPSSGSATGATPQAARTNAGTVAQETTLRAALEEIRGYVCEEPCMPRLYLNISRPDANKPAPIPAGIGFQATATCDWTGTFSCRQAPGKGAAVEAQSQEFACSDPWTIVAEGTVTGREEKGQPPTDFVAQAALMAKVLQNLLTELTEELASVVYRIKCPTARCKNKEFRILLWPPAMATAGPDAAGNFTWKASQWYRVEAHCTPD